MSDLDLLRKMIREDVIVGARRTDSGRFSLRLEETNTSKGSEYSIELCNVPQECIAIKVDRFVAQKKFFRNDKGQSRRSDYIIITSFKSNNWIIYIELKKGKGTTSTIVQQLKGSQCLIDYCRSLGRSFWGASTFLESSDYQLRFVTLRAISMNKTGTKRRPKFVHDSPDTMLTLFANNQLQFRELLRY